MKLIKVFAVLIIAAFILSAIPTPTEGQGGKREFKSTHLNLKADDKLSPETEHANDTEAQKKRVKAKYDNYGVAKANRQWVDVGTWTSDGVAGDFTIKGTVVFNIWFEEVDDGTDNSPDWQFDLKQNDQSVAHVEKDGTDSQPNKVIEVTASVALSDDVQVKAGDKLSVYIQYRGWEDCDVYYDNITYDSGVKADMDSLSILEAGSDKGVYAKFFDAFGTNWDKNGKFFCSVSFSGSTIYGSEQTEVSDGGDVQGDNGTTYKTTMIKFNDAKPSKGTSVTVTISYFPAENGSAMGWSYTFTATDSGSSGSSGGIGGLGGSSSSSTSLIAVVVVVIALGGVGAFLYKKRQSTEEFEGDEGEYEEEEGDYEEEEGDEGEEEEEE